jgi:hypothetical protein
MNHILKTIFDYEKKIRQLDNVENYSTIDIEASDELFERLNKMAIMYDVDIDSIISGILRLQINEAMINDK